MRSEKRDRVYLERVLDSMREELIERAAATRESTLRI